MDFAQYPLVPTAMPGTGCVDPTTDRVRRQHLRRVHTRAVGNGIVTALTESDSHTRRGASGELTTGPELRLTVRHRMLLGIKLGVGVGIKERRTLRAGVHRSR